MHTTVNFKNINFLYDLCQVEINPRDETEQEAGELREEKEISIAGSSRKITPEKREKRKKINILGFQFFYP